MRELFSKVRKYLPQCIRQFKSLLAAEIYFGRYPALVPSGAIIVFPCRPAFLCCGLSGLVAVKGKDAPAKDLDAEFLASLISRIEGYGLAACVKKDLPVDYHFLGGQETVDALLKAVRSFKRATTFFQISGQTAIQEALTGFSGRLARAIAAEEEIFGAKVGHLPADVVAVITGRMEDVKDAIWCLNTEILDNVNRIKALAGGAELTNRFSSLKLYKEINAVLNGIDRLEVRGRDSAGISIFFHMADSEYEAFRRELEKRENGLLMAVLADRMNPSVLLNHGIGMQKSVDDRGQQQVAVSFTYKVAAEIGSLGDNILFLRGQIAGDEILQTMAGCSFQNYTVSSHTRWASVGAICEANCHPVDNRTNATPAGMIHACLNGDIDNYLELKNMLGEDGIRIPEEITTDTKIIPLQIEKYVRQGHDIQEAFRLALNDFEGSHAITIQTDLAPGKLFLAQRGSGQAIFVGLAEDHYISASEVYGFVEETNRFLKLNGEKVVAGKNGPTQGQIFILSQDGGAGLNGVRAMYYDGTPMELMEADIKATALTGRDIDRQGYPHYFLKEISEAPASVEKTLLNRWKIDEKEGERRYYVALDETMVPATICDAMTGAEGVTSIRRIFFVGQGTAGVAAKACADILNYYMNDPVLPILALKSSELSGFRIDAGSDAANGMADTLVIAISQSGTTTDTNRAIDMVRAKGPQYCHCQSARLGYHL